MASITNWRSIFGNPLRDMKRGKQKTGDNEGKQLRVNQDRLVKALAYDSGIGATKNGYQKNADGTNSPANRRRKNTKIHPAYYEQNYEYYGENQHERRELLPQGNPDIQSWYGRRLEDPQNLNGSYEQ